VTVSRFDAVAVTRYYERHTPAFVRFGQGRGSIHRAVWAPGTLTREQAFHDVDDRIAELVRPLLASARPLRIVDLGCGVGASLCYLAARLPIQGTGITLSRVQVEMASRRIAEAGLSARVQCLQGDFCDPPSALGPADLAFAIEAFVHGSSPEQFFAHCARLVKPGGLLVICDDVARVAGNAEAEATIEAFKHGWHINALLEPATIRAMARAVGFEHESTTDLTPHLELRRGRDWILTAIIGLLKHLPIDTAGFDPLVGGQALQTCLLRGWVGYEFIVFRNSGSGL
jgi:cyclopropane fatty-acyl-phospholipid synthase-like methyltransferase